MRVGIAVYCKKCGNRKDPFGRSAPRGAEGCNIHECDDYMNDPVPGSLWPGETEREFGYSISTAATTEILDTVGEKTNHLDCGDKPPRRDWKKFREIAEKTAKTYKISMPFPGRDEGYNDAVVEALSLAEELNTIPIVASWAIKVSVEGGLYTISTREVDGEHSTFDVTSNLDFEEAHRFVKQTLLGWGEKIDSPGRPK